MTSNLCRGRGVFLCCGLLTGIGVACQRPKTSEPVQAAVTPEYCIRVDRDNNGAAATGDEIDLSAASDRQRTLAFEMAGYSETAPDATPEQRAAATQAAVIDAFCKALIEARASRGQSTADFTARIGPRMTVTHRSVERGYEVRIELAYRGVESLFIVRNGVLQHPPQDLTLVRRIFDETNGEFSLLATDASSTGGVALAKVACYVPAGLESRLAGDAAGEKVPTP
ncbi:MAG TPA: hypothetical protein VJZ71_12495 [Phycisphaerae bacterium]|nr:hypothetical protein [Phycisphaerae bacterium]